MTPTNFSLVCVCRWNAIIVDGHSVEELTKVLSQPRHQPTAIIAKTIKGKGISGTYRNTHTFLQVPNPMLLYMYMY